VRHSWLGQDAKFSTRRVGGLLNFGRFYFNKKPKAAKAERQRLENGSGGLAVAETNVEVRNMREGHHDAL
jgi:hypothetical protein